MEGRMIWFNEAKGFGFINTSEDERLYVEAAGFRSGHAPPARCAGMHVAFDRDAEAAPPRAVGVTFPPEPDQRRARFRQHRGGPAMRRIS
jgi:cold shock CspA family protein